ncbi:MAG: choice-of-anchor tandem repeat GloVer-containing protein [Terriglobales bacterium]
MNATRGALILAVISALLLIAARPVHAQTEIVLYNFCSQPNCADGEGSASSLTRDAAGNFYGTTALGGTNMDGTVFELSPNGHGGYDETVLYSFCSLANCADGNDPTSALIFDSAGNLYGTACSGGANGQGVPSACGAGFDGYGVVFELSPKPGGACPSSSNSGNDNAWCETVLYSFKSTPDGDSPFSGLTFDSSGNLYGTTYGGGSGMGTAYELSSNGKGGWSEFVLYSFCAQPKCADGAHPDGQMQAANGNFYATTETGGASAAGTVFGLSPEPHGGCPTGSFTGNSWCEAILHNFAGHPTDGGYPSGTPALDGAGNLYGTTVYGGHGRCNDVYKGCGTVWKVTPSGGEYTEEVLHSFQSGPGFFGCCFAIQAPDHPLPGLALDASGNLFGMTTYGGSPSYCQEKGKRDDVQGCGAMFELVRRPKGTKYTTELLWIFTLADGSNPLTSLSSDGGNLYGTTYNGGLGDFCPYLEGCGIAFEFTP